MSIIRILPHSEVPAGQGPIWGQATSADVLVLVPDGTPAGEWPVPAKTKPPDTTAVKADSASS